MRAVFEVSMAGAKAGRAEDRAWLTPFWFGNPKNEHDLKVSGGVTIMLPERKKAE